MRKALLLTLLCTTPACFAAHDLGTPLTADEIAAWNIDVAPDGHGLPAGSGDVTTGAHVFAEKCAACHGALGQGLIGDALAAGARWRAQNLNARLAVTGHTPPRCSTISAARCHTTHPSPCRPTKSMRSARTC
jgi:hypothetical protein